MKDELQQAFEQIRNSASGSQSVSALTMAGYLMVGGCMAVYLRFLYQRCSASASDTDSISRTFPMLLMITVAVISVVKSSLALSLGLMGALSIVRFRAAIKDPEELVYLFLCIAVGLALGAEQPLLAFALMGSTTIFIVGMHLLGGKRRDSSLLLTVRGDAELFNETNSGVMALIGDIAGTYSLHRFDIENGRGQLRVSLSRTNAKNTVRILAQLRERLPECEISYVNLNSSI